MKKVAITLMVLLSTTLGFCTEVVVTLTNANTEYSVTIPPGKKFYAFQARQNVDIRFSETIGKVATPTDPYLTLKSSFGWSRGDTLSSSKTIYFASGTAGTKVEVFYE